MEIRRRLNGSLRVGNIMYFLFLSICLNAQENLSYGKLISETNAFYGSNDLLHSGEIYQPEHSRAKGHPYFLANTYAPVTITMRGNTFENVTAKYNLETDQIIILTPADTNSITLIAIKQNWVDSFKINNRLFVNISNYDSTKNLKGYYELVYHGKKSFFVKYNKKFIDTYNDLSPNGFYSVLKKTFFFFDGVKFICVKNKNGFLQLFSENKLIVKKYFRNNKIKFSDASTPQLNKLMQFCDGLSK